MKPVTSEMIKTYKIKKLRYDFMGYTVHNVNQLSFHHLIIPRRDCHKKGYGDGYYTWNGAILVRDTAHDYLHTIERIDRDRFLAITKYMIEENQLGKLDINELRLIRDVLLSFEKEYSDEVIKGKNGKIKRLIKRDYLQDRIVL